jgi:predicted nucleic acid-binding Zn ribbon protein
VGTVEDDHRHCKVCGRACSLDSETCSKGCRTKREDTLRRNRTYTYLFYVAIALVAILFLSAYI